LGSSEEYLETKGDQVKQIKLNEDQIKYLSIFIGLKPFARQENLDRELGHDKQKILESELIDLGVLKRDKRGGLRGPSYHEGIALIRSNKLSLDEMRQKLNEEKQMLTELIEKDRRLANTDPSYCFYSRDVHESIAYTRDQINRWAELIQKMGG
jgi:hypothetical protein